ncbi:MAG: response regulator [Campylobacterales bacterium]|nr:response regulator [Campylobacterales bacterium]
MITVETISKLKEHSEGLTLLYVEDNEGLRIKAHRLMEKFFSNVVSAADGEEGLAAFKEHHPQIVITDINMPKLDGIEMIALIKELNPSTKFIIISAFDDKAHLMRAIKVGIFGYLKKPIKIDELTQTLLRCIESIDTEENSSLFNSYMDDLLNYQSDLLALVSKGKLLFVNQMFLDFFGVQTLEAFDAKHADFGVVLREHKGFLYNREPGSWYLEASREAGKLFHVKIANEERESRHFVLKMHPLPKKKEMYIMSLNDITELNLLSLFDSRAVEDDEKYKNRNTLVKLMEVVQKNSAEIKIHNFYKGLTITNVGMIAEINEKHIVVKSSYVQQKAVQYQRSMLISSEIFPSAVLCEPIIKIDFEQQTIIFKEMRFLPRNPTQRKSVRVCPEEQHTVSLFYEERKFYGEVRVHDISVDAVKLELNALPAGLKTETKVVINMVLANDKKPMIIHVPAEVLRVDELARSFFVVVLLESGPEQKRQLIEYVSRRQMNLIREFKGMQFG